MPEDTPFPIAISFHKVARSKALEADLHARAAKLAQFRDRIVGCRVVVVAPHRRHRKGTLYRVRRIDVSVPGDDIIVDHQARKDHAHEDSDVAVRGAFDAARRRAEDCARGSG
jgi:hypothetical protein